MDSWLYLEQLVSSFVLFAYRKLIFKPSPTTEVEKPRKRVLYGLPQLDLDVSREAFFFTCNYYLLLPSHINLLRHLKFFLQLFFYTVCQLFRKVIFVNFGPEVNTFTGAV